MSVRVAPRRLLRRLHDADIEAYLTIGVVVAIGLLNLLGVVDSQVVSTATLSILALLAFSFLRGHRAAGPDRTHLPATGLAGPGHTPAAARDIRLVGVSLNRTVRDNVSALQRCLRAGGSVRVVIIDPAGDTPDEAARRNGLPARTGIFQHRVRPTVDLLRTLVAAPGTPARLEVRGAPFVPAFGLTMVDPDAGHGWLSVDIYSHRPGGREPSLTFTAAHHPRWYEHFRAEFDQIWAQARPLVTISDSS